MVILTVCKTSNIITLYNHPRVLATTNGGNRYWNPSGVCSQERRNVEIRHFLKQFNGVVSKVKACLALGQEWVAWDSLLTSYVSYKEMQAHLAVVDLDRNVSQPEYGYVTFVVNGWSGGQTSVWIAYWHKGNTLFRAQLHGFSVQSCCVALIAFDWWHMTLTAWWFHGGGQRH